MSVQQIEAPIHEIEVPTTTLCIEGKEFPWPYDEITTKQIAELGGWDPSLGVIEIDAENNERTLAPDEVIKVTPDLNFGKKHRWKRG